MVAASQRAPFSATFFRRYTSLPAGWWRNVDGLPPRKSQGVQPRKFHVARRFSKNGTRLVVRASSSREMRASAPLEERDSASRGLRPNPKGGARNFSNSRARSRAFLRSRSRSFVSIEKSGKRIFGKTYQGLGGDALLEVVDVQGRAGGEVILDALEGSLHDGLGVGGHGDHATSLGRDGLADREAGLANNGGPGEGSLLRGDARDGAHGGAEAEGVHGHGSLHFADFLLE